MADAYVVKFQNVTMMSASEGEFVFKRGLKRRRVAADDVVGGAAIKDGCQGTASHTLTLMFETNTTNAATIEANVYERLQDLWNGRTGTLEVPEFVPLANCVIMDIDIGEQTRLAKAGDPETQELVDGVDIVATIEFEQT